MSKKSLTLNLGSNFLFETQSTRIVKTKFSKVIKNLLIFIQISGRLRSAAGSLLLNAAPHQSRASSEQVKTCSSRWWQRRSDVRFLV